MKPVYYPKHHCQRIGCKRKPDMMCEARIKTKEGSTIEKILLCYGCYNEQITLEGHGR